MYARKRGGRIHSQPGQRAPVDHGAVRRSGGEFDVDQHHVIQSRAVADPASQPEG